MKIVFVSLYSPLSYLGGAEILTLVLAESLVKLGHRVTIYTAGVGARRRVRGVIIQETPLFMFPLRYRTTLLPLYSTLLKGVFFLNKDFKDADIVHAVDSGAIILLSGWAFLRNRFVATIQDYSLIWPNKDFFSHGRIVKKHPSYIHALASALRRKVSYKAVSHLRYAICVSSYVANRFMKVNSKTHVAVIGNCVSPHWRNTAPFIKRDIDILYVGKLMPYKGLDVLLTALSTIPKKQSIRVVIVGEGLHERYAQLARRLGLSQHIIFTGPIPYTEISTYYLRSKIVVSPSIWPEPCGRSIIEAMWMGCAVVATNVGGTPESLVDGAHGYLVPPNRPHLITKACVYLLQNPKNRDEYGRRAAQYARLNYSSDRIAKEYLRFYGLIKSQRLII